jgi:hypothetical protein
MARVAMILAVFAGVVTATAWGLVAAFGGAALDTGWALFSYRLALAQEIAAVRSADVVWLGDSTIMTTGGRRSYPSLLTERVLAPHGRRSVIVAVPGLDFFGYYALMAPVLATRPRVVVVIANLRLLVARGMRARRDLVSFVPVGELPRLLTLPYAMRDMSAPGLLLAECLRFEPIERAMLLEEGARLRIADSTWWRALGPPFPAGADWSFEARSARETARHLREYGRAIPPNDPMMRFAAATVAMGVRHAARVVVVIAPVPLAARRTRGVLEGDRLQTTLATLRTVVTAAGGTLVDLHAALRGSELSDADAHYTEEGAGHMADLVRLPIAMALGEPRLAADAVGPPRYVDQLPSSATERR